MDKMMFTIEDMQALLDMAKRATITGNDAEAMSELKQKIVFYANNIDSIKLDKPEPQE